MKRHYSFVIEVCCTALVAVTVGMTYTAFSSYMPYILEEFHLSNTANSTINTVRCLVGFISMYFVDRYYRWLGLRKGIFCISLLAAVGFIFLSFSNGVVMIYIGSVILGFVYGLAGFFPAAILIRKWFRDKQEVMLGICSAGSGIAVSVVGPAIIFSVEKFGLLATFLYEGLILIVISVLLLIFIVEEPEKIGAQPFISSKPAVKREKAREKKVISRIPLSRPLQAMMVLAIVFMGMIGFTASSHYNIHMTVLKYPEAIIAVAMTLQGVLLTAGKLVYGYINEKIGSVAQNWMFLGMTVLGLALMSFAFVGWTWIPYVAVSVEAFGMSVATVGLTIWVGELTTDEDYNSLHKSFQMAYILGGLSFASVPGIIADITGTYTLAYVWHTFCAIACLLLVDRVYRKVKAQNLSLTQEKY